MKKDILKIVHSAVMSKVFKMFFSFNIKPVELLFKNEDKCLVIAPHPDDESIGCGGVLNLYPNNFEVICLTYGKQEDIREKEFKEAMNVAEINKFSMMALKDKSIIDGFSQFKEIDISNYDYIFIPNIFDQHKDHKAVAILLSKLLSEKKYKKELKIAFYEVWSTLTVPSHFANITSVVDKKREMINKHESQIATKSYADKIIGLKSYRGLLKNIDFAEAFCILNASDFKSNINNLA